MNNWSGYNYNSHRTCIAQSTASVGNDYFANTEIISLNASPIYRMIHTAWSACRLTIQFGLRKKNTNTLNIQTKSWFYLCIDSMAYYWSHTWESQKERMHAVVNADALMKTWSNLFWKQCALNGFLVFFFFGN